MAVEFASEDLVVLRVVEVFSRPASQAQTWEEVHASSHLLVPPEAEEQPEGEHADQHAQKEVVCICCRRS